MKKAVKIGMVVLALCLLCGQGWAENTVNTDGNFITITDIDSDWTWTSVLPGYTNGVSTMSVQFNPGAADDKAVFKNGSDAGPEIFPTGKCVDEYDSRIKYFDGVPVKIYFDYSESVISAGASISITVRLPVADRF